MRFAVAGGGVAGLAAGLALARAGHEAVILERDVVEPGDDPLAALAVDRRGIPHYQQPHAFLPRGRRVLADHAPDVLEALRAAGAEEQDLAAGLRGPRQPGDEDLVYLWVRRPIVEWALRRAAVAQPGVTLRPGVTVTGLRTDCGDRPRATGVETTDATVPCDVVVDALGRYRCPPGWPRAAGEPSDSGAVYYCRYFALADGATHHPAPLLNPRGDLGYMGFNTFRGDNRTFAVILLAPAADRALRVLRDERTWMTACAAMTPLAAMTAPAHGRPVTGVMPMGGLMNVDRTGDPGVDALVAVGDAFCHTDPAFAWGLSFALIHAAALADVVTEDPDPLTLPERFRRAAGPEAQERHALACATDAARARRWSGEPLDLTRRDGCYELFAFGGALAAAPHDDDVLRRTIGRVGLLERTGRFDEDDAVQSRIETILASAPAPAPPGPPRAELLARLAAPDTMS